MEHVVIEPMTEEFILWRCLHGGPLSQGTMDQWPSSDNLPWKHYRERNIPFLEKLTRTYGACAILAREGDRIVGQLRFYPKVICEMEGAGGPCLQQDPPGGPAEDFAGRDFPGPEQIEDKTLFVHCLMTGTPLQKDNPYQRKGIATRMVRTLIEWAGARGWEGIEAESFEDLPLIYEGTGSAGHTFWEKLGFRLVDRHMHPALEDREEVLDFITTLEAQAKSAGLPPGRVRDRLVMRFDLR